MKYVALLRGINVGGKARVEMTRLKQVFIDLGCTDVSTYINSGNVIFSDKRKSADLQKVLETDIQKEFGFFVPVLVVSLQEIEEICSVVPKDWTNDVDQKTDVLFLWDEIRDKSILKKVVHNPELESVLYAGGALIWNIGRQNVTRGSGIKLVKTDLYTKMTARNINTVRTIQSKMMAILSPYQGV